jgi:hypothetical protein
VILYSPRSAVQRPSANSCNSIAAFSDHAPYANNSGITFRPSRSSTFTIVTLEAKWYSIPSAVLKLAMVSSHSSIFVVAALLFPLIQAQFRLFPNGTHSTANLAQSCITALNATITCDPYIQQLVATDYYGSLGNATLQDTVCAAACGTSLASYHANVAQACTNSPQPWPGVPAIWAGDVIWATYNRTCLKDPATGQYCVGE